MCSEKKSMIKSKSEKFASSKLLFIIIKRFSPQTKNIWSCDSLCIEICSSHLMKTERLYGWKFKSEIGLRIQFFNLISVFKQCGLEDGTHNLPHTIFTSLNFNYLDGVTNNGHEVKILIHTSYTCILPNSFRSTSLKLYFIFWDISPMS